MGQENTVLFVDDEAMVLSALKRGLRREKYNQLYINDPKEVMKEFEEQEISVIVTDMRMPEINGLDLLRMVKEASPDTIRIVLSGYTQLPQVLAALNYGEIYKFVTKPWSLEEEFIPTIREAVEKYNSLKKLREEKQQVVKQNELYRKIVSESQVKEISVQNEIDRLKEVMEELYLRTETATIDSRMQELLTLQKDVQFAYLNSIPAVNVEFTLYQLQQEIKMLLGLEQHPQVIFEITGLTPEQGNLPLRSNFILIINTFRVLNKYLIKCINNLDISTSMKFEKQGQMANINFMKRLDFKSQDHFNEFELLTKELGVILKRLGAGLDLLNVNGVMYYRFNMRCEIMV